MEIDGRKLVDIICKQLEREGILLYDSNIKRKLEELTSAQLFQAVTLGDVINWHNGE